MGQTQPLRKPKRYESPCAATKELVRVEVTPTEVRRVEPPGAVASFITPPTDISQVRVLRSAWGDLLPSAG